MMAKALGEDLRLRAFKARRRRDTMSLARYQITAIIAKNRIPAARDKIGQLLNILVTIGKSFRRTLT